MRMEKLPSFKDVLSHANLTDSCEPSPSVVSRNQLQYVPTKHVTGLENVVPNSVNQTQDKMRINNSLYISLKTVQKGRTFQCEMCDRGFYRKEHLQRHIRTHTKEKPYSCDICQYKFGRKDALQTHKARVHSHTVSKNKH